jgi:Sugar phosphate permease
VHHPEQSQPRPDQGFLTPRRRRLAWIGFLLLAAYAPVVAWLTPDDSWMMPIAVAGVVGYAIVVDDVLRHRRQTATRDRPVDGPGSSGSDRSEREISSD